MVGSAGTHQPAESPPGSQAFRRACPEAEAEAAAEEELLVSCI